MIYHIIPHAKFGPTGARSRARVRRRPRAAEATTTTTTTTTTDDYDDNINNHVKQAERAKGATVDSVATPNAKHCLHHIHVCMCVYIYIHMYIYIYMYICIHYLYISNHTTHININDIVYYK